MQFKGDLMSHARRIPGVMIAGLCTVTLLYAQSNESKQNAADLLRTFKTIYVQSKTPLAKPQMLAGELQKNDNFDSWGLSITNNPAADVTIEIDHQPGWFYYTYTMTHQSSGIVLARGGQSGCVGRQVCLIQDCQGNYEARCGSEKSAQKALAAPSVA
jgi:hypothetical protein